MSKVIVVDAERCLACKQCMIECAMAHAEAKTLVEALARKESLQPRLHVESAGQFGMPLQCRHCEDAPCIAVCPTEAINRVGEAGLVLLDQDRCIGCKFCIFACPFGVIDLSRTGKAVIKCDLCIKRTEAGEEPACVAACPTGALEFTELTEELKRRRARAAERIRLTRAESSPKT
ncbi:MAG: 4Fe-4S dicluster domain-containing protein [Planctomycetota bacterium]|jgi:carbon-monoxide dehydrogenase iron sulfur subunit